MISRIGFALAIYLFASVAAAQSVVRFDTSVGSFDMVLNPTNNSRLQGHVDNMLQYVENGNYNGSWINRAGESAAGEDFVLQMGGQFAHTKRPPLTLASTRPVAAFAPITGAPMISGLSNTFGTVSLALPGSNSNGGTSSFFVNVTDNSFLDQNFTVFAAISDMSVVNQIMALTDLDLTDPSRTPPFLGDETTFGNVPVQPNGFQVFIERAFVITDALSVAQAAAGVQATMATSVSAASGSGSSAAAVSSSSSAVPEPATAVMLLAGAIGILSLRSAAIRRR